VQLEKTHAIGEIRTRLTSQTIQFVSKMRDTKHSEIQKEKLKTGNTMNQKLNWKHMEVPLHADEYDLDDGGTPVLSKILSTHLQ